MNVLFKKAAALLTAGLMAVSSLGAESFAESGKLTVSTVSTAYDAAVSKPTYQVKGTAGVRKIALSTTTAGATIYYTTNGKTPTTKSKQYTGKLLKITKDIQIKAIAVKGDSTSSVMKKTFKVATMLGDVTGDGNINQNDYNKLKNYLNGKTTYICKDNADCNGSGGLSSKDLTVLQMYLSAKISSLPYTLISVSKPTLSYQKVYGGLSLIMKDATSGATIYYTDDGTTPSTGSKVYSSPFTISSSKTIKTVAYKDGVASSVSTFKVTVGSLGDVQSDKNTSASYTTETPVTLTSSGSSRIIYTIDGSDPKTSSTASVYNGAIKLSKDTTIKAYAQAKGYADTDVMTFTYRVNAAFTISGTVWDDTPGTTTVANGIRATSEPGISGIVVYLVTSTTAAQNAPLSYVQKKLTDANGAYSFTGLTVGQSYKVVFEYNYMKYRAYNAVVNSGNQALAYTTLAPVTVKSNGTYTKTNNVDTLLNTVTKYSDAIINSTYTTYAITYNSYTATVTDADFALISKNYGALEVTMSVSGQSTTDNTVKYGDKLTYTVSVKNNTSMTALSLTTCEIGVYVPILASLKIESGNSMISTDHTFYDTDTRNYPGYYYLTVRPLSMTSIAPGKTFDFLVTGYVTQEIGAKLNAYAFVNSYQYSTPCYDYNSIPGNFTIGFVREKDEAAASVLTVTGGSSAGNKTISAPRASCTVSKGSTVSNALEVVVKNCKSIDDIIIGAQTGTSAAYTYNYTVSGDDLYIYFTILATDTAGSISIPIYLKADTNQNVRVTATVA